MIAQRANLVRHRCGHIILVIENTRNYSNRPARNGFLNEYHSASYLVPHLPPHIKSQIHFLEI